MAKIALVLVFSLALLLLSRSVVGEEASPTTSPDSRRLLDTEGDSAPPPARRLLFAKEEAPPPAPTPSRRLLASSNESPNAPAPKGGLMRLFGGRLLLSTKMKSSAKTTAAEAPAPGAPPS